MIAPANRRRRFLVAGSRIAAGVALFAALPGLHAQSAASRQGTEGSAVVALAFDPAGQALFKASPDAVSRSVDGGRRWSLVVLPPISAATRLKTIAVSAGAPGSLYLAGQGIGVLRSDDGGRTWMQRNNGLPGADVAAFTTHADRPQTVYAYLISKGIFRSEDGGQHWRLMDAGPRGGITSFIHSNMPGSMLSGWFFAAGTPGVRRAMDCFCGWRDAGELGQAVHAVAYDPRRPGDIYAATDAALFLSRDGGEEWSKVEQPVPTITALVVTPQGVIYAAGTDGRLFVGATDAASWKSVDA